jgi:Na+/H+-dicarboxylate symporter
VSLTARVLIGLATGLAAGMLLALTHSPALDRVVALVEPVGAIFINGIRMTVIPLVVASLIAGVASAGSGRAIGAIAGRALVLFVVILFAGALFSVLVATPLLARLHIDPTAAASLRASAEQGSEAAVASAQKIPTFAQWLIDLVPANPIKAAADGAMLPLIVFSLAFGLALTRLDAERRLGAVRFFQGVADAMIVLVRWILVLAPVGVFALALPLAARLGASAAGALLYYTVLVVLMCVVFIALVLYPAAVIGGGIPLRQFARAAAPAQAVAFSARSSLAALPALIEGAHDRLGAPETITGFFLPLAASTFRAGSAIGITVGALFVARLYGIELGVVQLASVVLGVVLITFSVPGVPAGSIIVMVPILAAAGVPIAAIGLLIAIDTIPDMFRTTTNVTGSMAVAAILTRGAARPLKTPS